MSQYQVTLDEAFFQRLVQADSLKPLLEQLLNQVLQAQVTQQIGAVGLTGRNRLPRRDTDGKPPGTAIAMHLDEHLPRREITPVFWT